MAEDIRSQSTRHANSCFFTMVAVDDARQPVPVPALDVGTPDQRRRRAAAQIRRDLRQEFEQRQREASRVAPT